MKKLVIPIIASAFIAFSCSSPTPENKEKSTKEKEEGLEEALEQLPTDTAAAKEFEDEYNKAMQEVNEDTKLTKDTKTE
ncbi:MAG: hypothetical protein A2W91_18980 [Bacteroidetes bacterium GWF2_38_335]|nr:MAG: hypothetical protein A2W91_18980 [Bacteroidetes bacterium GWF2_38_335]OFY80242.1 MAG: hypothetical protein A2281_17215 [Bacteroidetes bacterium RIFOXYA12_FULL_38_20]HBS88728.1 hypothetical protein [Bacteroidales bacterium]